MSRTKKVRLTLTQTIEMEAEIPLNSSIHDVQSRNSYLATLKHFDEKQYPQVRRSSHFDIIPLDQNEPA